MIDAVFIVTSQQDKIHHYKRSAKFEIFLFRSVDELIGTQGVVFNIAIIATPPEGRGIIIKKVAPLCEKVFCEKPLSLDISETSDLVQFLSRQPCEFIIDYVHLFSKEFYYLLMNCNPKERFKISSIGGNRGPYRTYNSLWDYAPHDLSMIFALTGEEPTKISVNDVSLTYSEGASYKIYLEFVGGSANILISNQLESKKRLLEVVTSDSWIFDDTKKNKLLLNSAPIFLSGKSPLNRAMDFLFGIDTINGYDKNFFLDMALKISKTITQIHVELK